MKQSEKREAEVGLLMSLTGAISIAFVIFRGQLVPVNCCLLEMLCVFIFLGGVASLGSGLLILIMAFAEPLEFRNGGIKEKKNDKSG